MSDTIDNFDVDTSGMMLRRQCKICAAIVGDREIHLAWHERLRDALQHGLPVVSVDDLDQ